MIHLSLVVLLFVAYFGAYAAIHWFVIGAISSKAIERAVLAFAPFVVIAPWIYVWKKILG